MSKQHSDELIDMLWQNMQVSAFWERALGYLRQLVALPTADFLGPRWRGRGARHQALVEPLDIARWYSTRGREEKLYDDETLVRPPHYGYFKQPNGVATRGLDANIWDLYREGPERFQT